MKKANKRTLRLGSYSMAVSAAVLVILIFINMLVSTLPSSVTGIDTTSTKINSIGDQTIDVLNSVNQEVNIYLIVEESNETSVAQIDSFIKLYADKSSYIKYSKIDPALYPNFASQYTSESLTDGAVIVVSDQRSYVINGNEWFMYETDYGNFDSDSYNYYAQMGYFDGTDPYMFYGESNLTTAIDNVTASDLPKLYLLSGHGESELTDTYSEYLSKDSVDTEDLSLLTGDMSVPDDCDILMINQPQYDISETEVNTISEYFQSGGNVILVTSLLNYTKEKMPNLAALAESMGFQSEDGIVIEQDSRYYTQYPLYLVPKTGSGGPMSLITTSNLTYFLPNAHGITATDDTSFTRYDLLSTSDNAIVKPNIESFETFAKEDGDIDGPFDVAAASVLSTDDASAKFAWFSSPAIVDENYDYGGNSALFTSTVDWMCDKTTNISIIGTEMDNSYLTATSADVTLWNTVLMGLLPISFLGGGFYIWLTRRKK